MAEKKEKDINHYISRLEMNGLKGRMLHMPPPKGRKKEILFVYGHHSSLERWWGVVLDLSQYGAVTMPDLPGFGGMDSFYKINQKPTIDNLADYLAAFIKMRYKRKKVVIIGISFGFVIVTRMLQKYPHLTKNVDLLASVVGFSHHSDFTFSATRLRAYKICAGLFSLRLPAIFFKNVLLNTFVLKLAYAKTHNAKHKFKNTSASSEFQELMNFEVKLWNINDVRTHMFTSREFLKLDNCSQNIKLTVHHVYTKNDNYFNTFRVIEHLKVVFSKVVTMKAKLPSHAPSVIASLEIARPLIPAKLRTLLKK